MFTTPANRPTRVLLVILCLFCAGCVHYSTPAERDASFSPYEDAKVGQESLRKYLTDRSAVLLMAERLDTTFSSPTFLKVANTNAWHGTAAAIDKRGYFLTAAHCVGKGQFWLVFLREGKLQVEHARIVWRGDVKKRGPDLAVLCVSHPIGQTFEWASDFTNGAQVVDVGLTLDGHSQVLKEQCMAGRVLKVSKGFGASPDFTVLSHTSPLRHGDSGGPLVLSDGRLLGINVSATIDFEWSHFSFEPEHSEAHRPDLAWLQEVIDADAALQSRSWPNQSPEPTAVTP
jgi:S1-C subfamily serine protease